MGGEEGDGYGGFDGDGESGEGEGDAESGGVGGIGSYDVAGGAGPDAFGDGYGCEGVEAGIVGFVGEESEDAGGSDCVDIHEHLHVGGGDDGGASGAIGVGHGVDVGVRMDGATDGGGYGGGAAEEEGVAKQWTRDGFGACGGRLIDGVFGDEGVEGACGMEQGELLGEVGRSDGDASDGIPVAAAGIDCGGDGGDGFGGVGPVGVAEECGEAEIGGA